QEKRLPYQADPALPGGAVMQRPPEGTLPTDAPLGEPLFLAGVAGDRWADRIPMPVDRGVLEAGRRHFDTFCAACHGVLGDGDSVVARRMALRKPRDLVADDVRAYPPGRIFQAVRQGYGLMPSYRVQLGVEDTWGVVAYVRALQLARGARVAEIPDDVKAALAKEAP
ncbi:MAG TPA: cytochrome c, partial [Polyangiaceae bacterium]|nr:cytochrome c [Polyangiaceae bacterium]